MYAGITFWLSKSTRVLNFRPNVLIVKNIFQQFQLALISVSRSYNAWLYLTIFTKRSACPLLVRLYAGDVKWLIPFNKQKCLNSDDVNAAPLSQTIVWGNPYRDIKSYKRSIRGADLVYVFTSYTSTHFVCASTTTKTIWLLIGPRRSICSLWIDVGGNFQVSGAQVGEGRNCLHMWHEWMIFCNAAPCLWFSLYDS